MLDKIVTIFVTLLFLLMASSFIYACWSSQEKEIKDPTYYVLETEELKKYEKILCLKRVNNVSFISCECYYDQYIYKAVKNNKIHIHSICCEDKYKLCH
jgi:hypothetical protein